MADQKFVFVVDDERDLVELLLLNLKRAGYHTEAAYNGRQALEAIAARPPDLVVLDLMLPGMPGTEIASRLRTNPATAQVPIIMLTAKSQESDQVAGLTAGADDYVTKPFSTKVLLARIEALLRRSTRPTPDDAPGLALGPVSIRTDTHEVFVDGDLAKFTLTEYRLLAALIQAGGKVLSRQVLMSRAMGPGVMVTERTIDVHMTAIRKRLGPHSGLIKTVRGVGYRMTLEAMAEEA